MRVGVGEIAAAKQEGHARHAINLLHGDGELLPKPNDLRANGPGHIIENTDSAPWA